MNDTSTNEGKAQVMRAAKQDGSNVEWCERLYSHIWEKCTEKPCWNWEKHDYRIIKPLTTALTIIDIARMVADGGWYFRVLEDPMPNFERLTKYTLKEDWTSRMVCRDPINGPWYSTRAVPTNLLPWRKQT